MSSYPYQFQYVCVICIYTSIHLSMITLYSILTFSSWYFYSVLFFFFSILRFSLTRQRCASCTSELEVDRKVVPKGFFLSIVSTPTGATVFIVFVLVVVYQCGGFTNNILFHGASCTFKDACPQYKRWRKICKRTKQNYRYFKKQMKRIQRNVTQKYHTINEYDEQDKNNNDDGESEM